MTANTLDRSYLDSQTTEEMASSSPVPSLSTRGTNEKFMVVKLGKIPELERQTNYSGSVTQRLSSKP